MERNKKLPKIKPVHQGVRVMASSSSSKEFGANHIIDADLFTRWQYAQDDKERWIELDFKSPKTFNRVICGEYKRAVQEFKIEAFINGEWKLLVKGGNIRNNFNASFETITAQKYRLTILKASRLPYIAELTFVKY